VSVHKFINRKGIMILCLHASKVTSPRNHGWFVTEVDFWCSACLPSCIIYGCPMYGHQSKHPATEETPDQRPTPAHPRL
jgi:hypothetical protein